MRRSPKPLPPDYWLPNGLTRNTAPPLEGLIECETVLDVGAGLRPMGWYTPKRHICIDAYLPYVERLRAAGYEAYQDGAWNGIHDYDADAIYMLDMIEHVTKIEGRGLIAAACARARRQVVIYTPYGYLQQDSDGWGLGGDYWQTHRSGWLPEEFPGWRIQLLTIHGKPEGFYASYDQPERLQPE